MKPARRWLQFSLRGLLTALTIGCAWLGWKVERARKRGEAIDAIVGQGGLVIYKHGAIFNGDESLHEKEQRLWLDMAGEPVNVYVWGGLNATLRRHLPQINGTRLLCFDFDFEDADLSFLGELTNANEVRWESGRMVREYRERD
jgi:hypothetical protein